MRTYSIEKSMVRSVRHAGAEQPARDGCLGSATWLVSITDDGKKRRPDKGRNMSFIEASS